MAIATVEKAQVQKILANLAELGGQMFHEEDIIYEGNKLVVPAGMNLKDVILFVKRKIAEEEEVVQFSRTFKYRPWDGAYVAYETMRQEFGGVSHSGFFASPPQLLTIEVGPDQTAQIPWGQFNIPFLPDVTFTVGASHDDEYGTVFVMYAQGPKKHRFVIEGIFKLIDESLKTSSIYRGKAIDGKEQPSFIDLRGFDPAQIVYSGTVQDQLNGNVLAFLNYSDEMRKNGIPLKRAVLMYGPYGTGKSEFGRIVAKTATANGWTFLLARTGRDDLDTVMQTARLYGPAVVMFEDIDVIADPDSRDRDGISKLLDTFDGITAKDSEILMVLTTNHPDRLHKGILRPGRLDAVIEISHLDQDGVTKLIHNVIDKTDAVLADDVDWDAVFEAMEGFTPAFVKAAADVSVTFGMAANEGRAEGITLTTADLLAAAHQYRAQLKLQEGAKEHPARDPLGELHQTIVDERLLEVLPEVLAANVDADHLNGDAYNLATGEKKFKVVKP